MHLIDRLETLTHQGARWVALLGLAGLLALAFATILDVFLRWLFNAPITGVRDAASLFVAIVISCALSTCMAERRNITIRFLGKIMSPKWGDILEVFGNLITLIVFALVAWQVWLYANDLGAQKEVTMVLGWPISPWWRAVSIILALCIPVQIMVVSGLIKSPSSGGR